MSARFDFVVIHNDSEIPYYRHVGKDEADGTTFQFILPQPLVPGEHEYPHYALQFINNDQSLGALFSPEIDGQAFGQQWYVKPASQLDVWGLKVDKDFFKFQFSSASQLLASESSGKATPSAVKDMRQRMERSLSHFVALDDQQAGAITGLFTVKVYEVKRSSSKSSSKSSSSKSSSSKSKTSSISRSTKSSSSSKSSSTSSSSSKSTNPKPASSSHKSSSGHKRPHNSSSSSSSSSKDPTIAAEPIYPHDLYYRSTEAYQKVLATDHALFSKYAHEKKVDRDCPAADRSHRAGQLLATLHLRYLNPSASTRFACPRALVGPVGAAASSAADILQLPVPSASKAALLENPGSFITERSTVDVFSEKALAQLESQKKVPIPLTLENLCLTTSDYRFDAVFLVLSEAFFGDATAATLDKLTQLLFTEITSRSNANHYQDLHWLSCQGNSALDDDKIEGQWARFLDRLQRNKLGCSELESAGTNSVVLHAFAQAARVDILLISPVFSEKVLLSAQACPLLPKQGTLLLGVMCNNQFGFYKHVEGVNSVVTSVPTSSTPSPVTSSSSSSSSSSTFSSTSSSTSSSTNTPPDFSAPQKTPSSPASSSTSSSSTRSGVKTGLVSNDLTPEQREELRIAKAIEAQAARVGSDPKDPTVETVAATTKPAATAPAGGNWREKREREEREKAERAEREQREKAAKQAAIEGAAVEAQKARDEQASTGWKDREIENPNQPAAKELSVDPRKWDAEDVSIWLQKQGAPSVLRAHLFKNQVAGQQLLSLHASSPLLSGGESGIPALLEWVSELQVGVENLIAMGL